LGFFIPREGTNIFVDALCIPVGSRQKEAAEMYINFMLEPEIGAANAEYIGYATPNAAALEVLDEEITGNEVAYPPSELLTNTEYFVPLPQETSKLMDQLWTELLSNDEQYNRMLVPVLLFAAILASIGINLYRMYRRNRRNYFQ
jgi:spermidine/putrescine transport system substrate-binding protein